MSHLFDDAQSVAIGNARCVRLVVPVLVVQKWFDSPLCGVHVPPKQDGGCPVIEAFGIVMAESKRAITEGPTPP